MFNRIAKSPRIFAAILLTCASAPAPAAVGNEVLLTAYHEPESKKACYGRALLRADGTWKAWTHFKNAHPIDGDTFVSVLTVSDKNGNVIFKAAHRAGVNAMLLGGPNYGKPKALSGKFSTNHFPFGSGANYKLSMGCKTVDTVDDLRQLERAWKAGKKIIGWW